MAYTLAEVQWWIQAVELDDARRQEAAAHLIRLAAWAKQEDFDRAFGGKGGNQVAEDLSG